MTLLTKAAGVMVLGFAIAACGGGNGGGEEGAIKDVFSDFFKAFEDDDAARLADLLTDDCEDSQQIATAAIQSFRSRVPEDVDFNVTGVTIRDLTEDSAEAIPEGIVRFEEGESPLAEADAEYARLKKVDGEWKLADCNILF